MDIDDEVIIEYDVVLNTPQPVSLLQYPLRPRYRSYGDQGSLLSASISEDYLHLHYSLDTNSKNFDRSNSEFKRDTQILSGKYIKPLTKHCVGYVKDGILALTPLEKLLQIRPDTSYLDSVLDKKQMEDKEENENLIQEKDSKKLRVYKKKEAKEVPKEMQERKLACHDMKSAESIAAFQYLFPENISHNNKISSEEYLKSILPIPLKTTGFRDNLKTLPISLAIEELLKKAFVVNTDDVLEIFPNEKNIEN